jgi:hypothetical protein
MLLFYTAVLPESLPEKQFMKIPARLSCNCGNNVENSMYIFFSLMAISVFLPLNPMTILTGWNF